MRRRPMEARRTIALFSFSGREKARLAPMRLRALAEEAARRDAELVLVCGDDCAPGRDIPGEVWADDGWRPAQCGRPGVVIIDALPVIGRQRAVYDWLRASFPTIETVGPDKAALPDCFRGGALERLVIPHETLPAEPERLVQAIEAAARRGPVVIKPARGSSGRGVQFLRPDGAGWTLQREAEIVAGDLPALAAAAARGIAGRAGYREYLLQRFVRSAAPDGRPVQLRIDLHKDRRAAWRLVGASAHLGAHGLLVSNVARGGLSGSLDAALAGRRARCADVIREEALALAVQIAEVVDRRPGVRIRELGVDLAVDDDDRLWLLEANARPVTTSHERERAEREVEYALAVADGLIADAPGDAA